MVDDDDADKGFRSIKMGDGQQCMRVLLGDLPYQNKVLGIVIAANEMARVDTTNGVEGAVTMGVVCIDDHCGHSRGENTLAKRLTPMMTTTELKKWLTHGVRCQLCLHHSHQPLHILRALIAVDMGSTTVEDVDTDEALALDSGPSHMTSTSTMNNRESTW